MIRIVFYEESRQREEKIVQEFSRIFNLLQLSYELHIILHREQLLTMIEKDPFRYDIVCLTLDHMEFTEKVLMSLREHNQLTELILMNGTLEGFSRLMRYKPSEWLTVEEFLAGKLLPGMRYRCSLLLRSRNQSFVIRTKTNIVRIPYKRINYFESVQRQVIVHGIDSGNTYAFLAKLDDVSLTLPKNIFCRCHKSLIINLNNVRTLDKSMKQFILNNGDEVDISKAHYKDVIDIFERFAVRN